MSVKTSQQFVIDASVGRAAGDRDTGSSKACREVLEEIRKVCHRMVMSPPIKREWDKHQSAFAKRWRVAMQSRKKIIFVTETQHDDLRHIIEQSSALQNEGERKQVRKDCILVEAALATDFRIISLDDKVRRLFARLPHEVALLHDVVWVNPLDEGVVFWLREGAKQEPSWCLMVLAVLKAQNDKDYSPF